MTEGIANIDVGVFSCFSSFVKKHKKREKRQSRFWQYFLTFLLIFKGPNVGSPNVRQTFWDQKGSPRDPRGDQKGAKKDPRAEKVTFQKHQYSLSKTILSEARGGQKAPQGAPKATSKTLEKTKTEKGIKKEAQRTSDHYRG